MRWGGVPSCSPPAGAPLGAVPPCGHHRYLFSIPLLLCRFRSVHCLLYPDTPWCPSNVVY